MSNRQARGTGAERPLAEVKAEFFKALAHPGRIRILEVLARGERTVGELAVLVDLEPSHLSQQLGILKRAGLVTARKQGSSVHYELKAREVSELLHMARRFLASRLSETTKLLSGLRS